MQEVSYHADGYGTARPAINVKSYHPGNAYHSLAIEAALGHAREDRFSGIAYDSITEQFWHDAAIVARELGLGEIEQQGRSGGWLVLVDAPADGDGEMVDLSWLAAYGKLRAWADAYISDAPRMVRERARSLAIDAVGRSAAQRMFGRA